MSNATCPSSSSVTVTTRSAIGDHLRHPASTANRSPDHRQCRGAAASPEGSLGPLPNPAATGTDQTNPATHLGGPRLASLGAGGVSLYRLRVFRFKHGS